MGGRLVELAFINMSWVTKTAVGETPKVRPLQDPNRMELLSVRHIKLTDGGKEYSNQMFEVLRSKKSKVVDLVAFPAEVLEAKDYLLFGLIAAYQDPHLTDAQIMQIIRDEQGP